MRNRQGSELFMGLFLVVVGLLFLAERQHLLSIVDVGRLWPVILILLGVGRFVAPRQDGSHRGGVWLVFLGGLFLLNNFDVFTFDRSWPLFIVAGGVAVLLGRGNRRATTTPAATERPHS